MLIFLGGSISNEGHILIQGIIVWGSGCFLFAINMNLFEFDFCRKFKGKIVGKCAAKCIANSAGKLKKKMNSTMAI